MQLLSAYLFIFVLLQKSLAVFAPQAPCAQNSSRCSLDVIHYPSLFGAEILSMSAREVHNFSIETQGYNFFVANVTGLNFCNVSLTYTHPGQGDVINVHVWLPLENWNSRYMGTGGGQFATGIFDPELAEGIVRNYAAAATDGGHTLNKTTAKSWALVSPGNVNQYLLQDFASVALNDMTVLAKDVIASYYSSPPNFSYWVGCSTGGRQGLMMAQRYPEAYDGILASCPAINWPSFTVAEYWPRQVMNRLGTYPPQCEFNAINAAAIEACDGIDGVVDGIISAPGLCNFDPHVLVGQSFDCEGSSMQFSSTAATIALATWTGPRTTGGAFEWYGLNPGASFAELAGTTCNATNQNCIPVSFTLAEDWISLFVEVGNPAFNVTNMTHSDYDRVFHYSNQLYQSIIGTNDPNLTYFRDAGGKMITWHGLADELIMPNGTTDYYQEVLARDPNAADYYRVFEVPGVPHCASGRGPFPNATLDALVQWVEQGVVPDVLNATTLPDVNGHVRTQQLCRYPFVSAYTGGDPAMASSYRCAPSY